MLVAVLSFSLIILWYYPVTRILGMDIMPHIFFTGDSKVVVLKHRL
jgi:hypothetical protein